VVQLRRQGLLERYEAMLNKPGSPLGRALAAANEDGMNTREWLRRRVRCPLLNMSEECFVYKARPVVCRLYVTNGPSENCWEPGARIPSLDRRDSRDAAWAAFDATSKEAGIPLLAAPLPVTLEWALWVELRGISYLKTKLAGTIHASQVASMLHWGRLENPSGRTWEMTEDFGFKCGICERVSHNRNDLKNRYCAQCNVYHEDLERTAQIHK
jgi:Fe-S-cluster containining protein